MVLARDEIQELIREDRLKIGNFDPRYLEPATYDMRLGNDVFVVSSHTAGTRDLETNRILVIGASEFALVGTYETLDLPNDVVGHFGLKSSLSRRGLYASIGAQIDPGFRGRLFVSLFNLTPAPIPIDYLDTFLTVEFSRLEHPPATGYEGPNQGKYHLNADDIAPFLNVQIPSLAKIHQEFGDLTQNLRTVASMVEKIDLLFSRFDTLLSELKRQGDQMNRHIVAVESLAHGAVRVAGDLAPIEARQIDIEQAVQEIHALFRSRRRLFYSDIAQELHLDIGTVMDACAELEHRGLIEGDSE